MFLKTWRNVCEYQLKTESISREHFLSVCCPRFSFVWFVFSVFSTFLWRLSLSCISLVSPVLSSQSALSVFPVFSPPAPHPLVSLVLLKSGLYFRFCRVCCCVSLFRVFLWSQINLHPLPSPVLVIDRFVFYIHYQTLVSKGLTRTLIFGQDPNRHSATSAVVKEFAFTREKTWRKMLLFNIVINFSREAAVLYLSLRLLSVRCIQWEYVIIKTTQSRQWWRLLTSSS